MLYNKMKIVITQHYGFAHYWTLIYRNKRYHLGQDVKFCNRVLNMLPRDVVKAIGDNDLSNEKTNRKLARFIVSTLKERHLINFKNLQTWELCAD
jgi:hypothetical protein